jgi:hypothetical protein
VLKGEMSLVGPRPGLFNQQELTTERAQRGVFDVRPGITGLAQLSDIDMSTPKLLAETDQRMIRELTLAHYFKQFDSFVATLEHYLTFSQSLNPASSAETIPVVPKPATPSKLVPTQSTPKVETSHSRIASATVPLSAKTQCTPCDTPCLSCFVKGHVAIDCPTKHCGFCAAHQRRAEHFPKMCFHYDYDTGIPKPQGGKAKSTRAKSSPATAIASADTASLPDLLDDSSSSEVSDLSVLFDSGSSEHIIPQQFLTQPSSLLPSNRIEMESAFGQVLSSNSVGSFKLSSGRPNFFISFLFVLSKPFIKDFL